MSKLLTQFSKIFPKYLLAAVLVIVPLFPKFPLFAVPGTYVAIRFEDLILLILAIVTFLKVLKNPRPFFKDRLVLLFLIFFGVNLISLFAGVFLTKTVDLHIGIFNYLRRIEYLVPLFGIMVLFSDREIKNNLGYYIKLLIIVTVVAFIYGLGQRYLAFPIIITQNDSYSKGVALRWTPGSHISSTFAGHYDLAAFMVMVLPLFITLLFTLKGNWNKFWFFVASAGGLWLLINSLSRISQVAYILAVGIALVFTKKYKALVLVVLVSLFFVARSSSLDARFGRIIEVFYQKVKSVKITTVMPDFEVHAATETLPSLRKNLTTPTPTPVPIFEDRSTSIRVNVEWPRAIRAFEINPLLGTGYSSIGLATDNDFLRMLGETGLLGLGAFVLIFVRIGKIYYSALAKFKKMNPLEITFIVAMIGAIFGTFVSTIFIDLFEASKFATLFWLMVGYSIRLSRINETDL